MSDLGQLLKKARVEKGMSLDDIQDITKIRKRYLEAIEEGNYKLLPGNFYVRAFIKGYAEAIGMDPDEVLQYYKSELPTPAPQTQMEPIKRKRKPAEHSDRWSKWATAILMWSFPILIIGIIYYYVGDNYKAAPNSSDSNSITDRTEVESQKPDPNETNHTEDDQTTEDPDAPANNPGNQTDQPAGDSGSNTAEEITIDLTKQEGSSDFYAIKSSAPLKVKMNIVGADCWFELRSGSREGKVIDTATLKDGEIKEWEIEGSLYIHVGRADTAQIYINDKQIDMGKVANPKKLQFDVTSS